MNITITNMQDIEQYINRLSTDFIKDTSLHFSEEFKPIFEVRLTGENFNSTINTTIMQSLLKLQKTIYMIYSLYTYGEIKTLTGKEKKELELFVKIESGSSIIQVLLDKIFSSEIFNNMSETTKQVAIIAVACVILGCAGLHVYDKIQEKKILTDSQVNNIKAITENTKEIYHDFSKINLDTIEIQGESIQADKLKSIGEKTKQAELLQNTKLSGLFKVLSIHFDYLIETSFMTAQYIPTGEIIEDISLQDCFISKEKLTMIENAEKKEPINLTISLTRKGSKVQNAHLDVSGN